MSYARDCQDGRNLLPIPVLPSFIENISVKHCCITGSGSFLFTFPSELSSMNGYLIRVVSLKSGQLAYNSPTVNGLLPTLFDFILSPDGWNFPPYLPPRPFDIPPSNNCSSNNNRVNSTESHPNIASGLFPCCVMEDSADSFRRSHSYDSSSASSLLQMSNAVGSIPSSINVDCNSVGHTFNAA